MLIAAAAGGGGDGHGGGGTVGGCSAANGDGGVRVWMLNCLLVPWELSG